MEALIGSENGLIKRIDIHSGKIISTLGSSIAENPVVFLDWLKHKEGFLISLTNQSLTIYKVLESTSDEHDQVKFESKAIGLHLNKKERKIFVIFEDGKVDLYSLKKMKLTFVYYFP